MSELSYTKNWILSQFGLYKYESPPSIVKINKKRNIRTYCAIGLTFLLLLSIAIFAICSTSNPFIYNKVKIFETSVENVAEKQFDYGPMTTATPTASNPESEIFFADHKWLTADHNHKDEVLSQLTRQSQYHEEIENFTLPFNHRFNREYVREREDTEKIRQPRNHWTEPSGVTMAGIRDQIPRPPKFGKTLTRRQFLENEEPHPFNYPYEGPQPAEFHRQNFSSLYSRQIPKSYTSQVNNIQDILRESNQDDNLDSRTPTETQSIQISGKYRHSKNSGMTKIFNTVTRKNRRISTTPIYNFNKPSNSNFRRDPFYPYKPKPVSEVNLMALNNFKFAPPSFPPNIQTNYINTASPYIPSNYPNYINPQSHISDSGNLYQQIIDVNNQRNKNHENIRKSNANRRPFSLMLDIYPMHEDEQTNVQTLHQARPQKPKIRKPYLPLPPGPGAVNNLQYSYQLDNSYYNSMNFPQIQQNRPPQNYNYYTNTFTQQQQQQQQQQPIDQDSGYNPGYTTQLKPVENKPSQIMVQLNLFPKKKPQRANYREGSNYEVIEPENIANKRNTEIHQNHREFLQNTNNTQNDDYYSEIENLSENYSINSTTPTSLDVQYDQNDHQLQDHFQPSFHYPKTSDEPFEDHYDHSMSTGDLLHGEFQPSFVHRGPTEHDHQPHFHPPMVFLTSEFFPDRETRLRSGTLNDKVPTDYTPDLASTTEGYDIEPTNKIVFND